MFNPVESPTRDPTPGPGIEARIDLPRSPAHAGDFFRSELGRFRDRKPQALAFEIELVDLIRNVIAQTHDLPELSR